jgi:hypothetical protein
MATADEVAALRLFVSEPDDSTYTDIMLSTILDAAVSTNAAAYEIWLQKAAGYSDVVDISEGGSQRKNSDLYKNAVTMAGLFKARVELDALGDGRTRITKLVRT